jgi:hypothetical protein
MYIYRELLESRKNIYCGQRTAQLHTVAKNVDFGPDKSFPTYADDL